MSIKNLYANLKLGRSVEEEQKAFVHRTNSFLKDFTEQFVPYGDQKVFFNTICYQLGVNGQEIIDSINRRSMTLEHIPNITEAFKANFFLSLQLIVATRNYFSEQIKVVSVFDEMIENIIAMSILDLGISYQSGMFFPKGEDVLDQQLIGNALQILSDFPNENKDLKNALESYTEEKKYGVVENCYRCIEGLLRNILGNRKTLIDNKADIMRKIGLSDHWKKILANYIDYGNEYGRHASENRHEFNEAEVEAYLYTTCILVRLIIKLK